MKIGEISNQTLLEPHPDLPQVIPSYQRPSSLRSTTNGNNASMVDNGNISMYNHFLCMLIRVETNECDMSFVRFLTTGYCVRRVENSWKMTESTKAPIWLSAGNNMWIGDVPKELRDLTIPEMRLITRYRHNSCITQLKLVVNDVLRVQSVLNGNVIAFAQLLSNIAKSLPLSLDDQCSENKIMFVVVQVTAKRTFK